MTISKKGKRKIVVNSKTYLWWGFCEYNQGMYDGMQIKIVIEDQSLSLRYGLQQSPNERHMVLALKDDIGVIHLSCPKFENDLGIITPSGVKNLICWSSLSPSESNVRKVTWASLHKKGWFKDLKSGACNVSKQQIQKIYAEILEKMNNA